MSNWWDDAVVYQVYPRSLQDSNGDGVGDLRGIISRLDYIAGLGVEAIWLNPFQPSPQVDNGYDVTQYVGVDPLFGNDADLDELIDEAHQRGLKVLVDVVPNHCSSQHPLFQAALDAGPGSPEREMFHFRASPDREPPNNWQSVFGGRAWDPADPESATDDEWYLHLFSAAQPDWNWENPRVHDMFDSILREWFDRGVDGMRVDVAHALVKAPGLPDTDQVDDVVDGLRANPLVSDQEPVHEIYRRWHQIARSYPEPKCLVGEVNLEPERAARFARPDELDQAFTFSFVKLPWDSHAWVETATALESAREANDSGLAWAIENHDVRRAVTRYGGGLIGEQRARAAVLALLALPGAVYVYQGQELGLPEVEIPEERRLDPMWRRGRVCRDGVRVPLPWKCDPEGGHGFTLPGVEPWLPQPPDWGKYVVELAETDPNSTLHLVREAIGFRRELRSRLAQHRRASWTLTSAGGVKISRGPLTVLIAMGIASEHMSDGEVLINSAELVDGKLPPNASAWIWRP